MPTYYYKCVDKNGKYVTGVMDAPDEGALEEKLKSIGYYLIQSRLEYEEPIVTKRLSLKRVKRRYIIEFFTQMNVQLKAGVPLIQALEVAVEECESKRFKQILESIYRDVQAGALFYEALEKYPEAFPLHVVSLIRAGEMSGRLPETFLDLRNYYEWLDKIINDIRQASIYPTIILMAVGTFVLALFTFVIPRFIELMQIARVPIPPLTQLVFNASEFAKATWWAWIAGMISFVLFIKYVPRISPFIAESIDNIKLKLPWFGEINRMIALTRFAHNLSLMYRAGIPILQALRLCASLVGNAVVEKAIRGVENTVTAGESIGEAMRRHKVFTSILRRMVVLGEVTGRLDETLEFLAHYYNELIPRKIKRLFSIAEPMIMVFLILLVGVIALSLFTALLSMMGGIK